MKKYPWSLAKCMGVACSWTVGYWVYCFQIWWQLLCYCRHRNSSVPRIWWWWQGIPTHRSTCAFYSHQTTPRGLLAQTESCSSKETSSRPGSRKSRNSPVLRSVRIYSRIGPFRLRRDQTRGYRRRGLIEEAPGTSEYFSSLSSSSALEKCLRAGPGTYRSRGTQ